MMKQVELFELRNFIPQLPKRLERKRAQKAKKKQIAKGQELYLYARKIAKQLWENGDNRLHNQMRNFLHEKYQEPNGDMPFSKYDPKDKGVKKIGFTAQGLLKALKEEAREVEIKTGRTLIYNPGIKN